MAHGAAGAAIPGARMSDTPTPAPDAAKMAAQKQATMLCSQQLMATFMALRQRFGYVALLEATTDGLARMVVYGTKPVLIPEMEKMAHEALTKAVMFHTMNVQATTTPAPRGKSDN